MLWLCYLPLDSFYKQLKLYKMYTDSVLKILKVSTLLRTILIPQLTANGENETMTINVDL